MAQRQTLLLLVQQRTRCQRSSQRSTCSLWSTPVNTACNCCLYRSCSQVLTHKNQPKQKVHCATSKPLTFNPVQRRQYVAEACRALQQPCGNSLQAQSRLHSGKHVRNGVRRVGGGFPEPVTVTHSRHTTTDTYDKEWQRALRGDL